MQLLAAVAAQAEQGIAGKALGMDTGQHRLAVGKVTQGQRHMLLGALAILEAVHVELAPLGRETGGFYVTH